MTTIYTAPLSSSVTLMKKISALTLTTSVALSPVMMIAPSSLDLICIMSLGALSISGLSTFVVNYCLSPYILSIKRREGDVLEFRTASVFGNPIVTVLRVGDIEPTKQRPFAIWSILQGEKICRGEAQGGRVRQFMEKKRRGGLFQLERRHFFGMGFDVVV
jgi:hypothetical protein